MRSAEPGERWRLQLHRAVAQQRGQEQALAAFGFLYHEMRRRFDRVDEKFDSMNEDVTDLKVSVARIEGYLGIGIPGAGEQREAAGQ